MKLKKINSLILICLICYFTGNSWTILPTISTTLLESTDYFFSSFQYGFLSFVLVFSACFFSYLGGYLGKKRGMKKVLLTGVICNLLSNGFYTIAFFSKFAYLNLVLGQIFLGIGISFILTSLSVYLSLLFVNMTAVALTGVYACINLGSFSYPILSNIFNFNLNWWKGSFAFFSANLIILLLGCYLFPSLKKTIKKTSFKSKSLSKRFWLFLFVITFYSICEISFTSWGILYLHKAKNFAFTLENLSLSIYWIVVALGQLAICLLVKKVSPKIIYRVLPVLITLGVFGLFFSHHKYAVIAFFALCGLGTAGFLALTLSFIEYEFYSFSETASGLIVSGYFLGSGLGSLFLGLTLEYLKISISDLFLFLGVNALIISFFVNYLMNTSKITKKMH